MAQLDPDRLPVDTVRSWSRWDTRKVAATSSASSGVRQKRVAATRSARLRKKCWGRNLEKTVVLKDLVNLNLTDFDKTLDQLFVTMDI